MPAVMDRTKRMRVSGEKSETIMRLPEDLMLEILTWVPARELGRCKSVCRLWKSLIGSPPFLPLYRCRNRCLLAYWSEDGRLHFHHYPLRSHRTDPDERFRGLVSFLMGRDIDPQTQPVNGVICAGVVADGESRGREPELQLKVISVATGQALRVPQPLPCDHDTKSSYSLGYDPRSRRYKLLRVIFRAEGDRVLLDHRMKADVITLGPTGSAWEWRKLDDDGAGINQLPLNTLPHYLSRDDVLLFYTQVDMFSGDGALCWFCNGAVGIVLFDMHQERFRYVKFPVDFQTYCGRRNMVPRVKLDQRLAIHMWVLPARGNFYKPCECFELEDEEGELWRKRSVPLRAELGDPSSSLGVANGSPIFDSSIMLISGRRREVYCSNGLERFWVGQLPDMKPFDPVYNMCMGHAYGRLSCLLDSNVLYLSLSDVLNGNGLD